jgi:hypothetical protein
MLIREPLAHRTAHTCMANTEGWVVLSGSSSGAALETTGSISSMQAPKWGQVASSRLYSTRYSCRACAWAGIVMCQPSATGRSGAEEPISRVPLRCVCATDWLINH